MEFVGTIRVDLSSVDVKKVQTKREHAGGLLGSRHYEVDCDIQVQFGSRSGLLEVFAYCGGVVAGRAEIDYD